MVRRKRAWNSVAGLGVVALLVGCGGKSEVPVDATAENIRELALGYVQFAAANQGVGPANKEALAKSMIQRGVAAEEVDKFFVSARDNQPFVIRWGLRPMGSGPVGPDPPKPSIIIFEASGADGTRYVADGQMSIKELSEEAFVRAVPDYQPTGE